MSIEKEKRFFKKDARLKNGVPFKGSVKKKPFQYYKKLFQYYFVLLYTTLYYSVLLQYHSSTTPYSSVIQSTTPVLLCTTQCYFQHYAVVFHYDASTILLLLCTTSIPSYSTNQNNQPASQPASLAGRPVDEKTDFQTFQLSCKNIQQIEPQCNSFFLVPVPCALEAQTVINTSCFDWRFPRKREKVRQ